VTGGKGFLPHPTCANQSYSPFLSKTTSNICGFPHSRPASIHVYRNRHFFLLPILYLLFLPTLGSNEPVARVFPDGEQVRVRTVFACPLVIEAVNSSLNLLPWEGEPLLGGGAGQSYNRTVLPAEQDARSGLVRFHAIAHTRSV
jgi:hypothetical protein